MDKARFFNKTKLVYLVLAIFIALPGCGGSVVEKSQPTEPHTSYEENSNVTQNKDIIIAMVPKSLDNPVFLDALEQGERVGRELGVKV